MAKIDRLSMHGFKSFANRTVVPFPSGFNVICGPNGSGKSNITESIMFVLGIRSSKAIRAGKLQDLIFNGGKGRKSSDYASVSMYIDNTSGSIANQPEELKITRKVNKNGVSVYKLNDRTVNRRQIVDILANAGLHADGHNIIMQGDVTHLIEMNAIERRAIIDEVSGIAEFDDKKIKAERELEKVDEKLKEARIVLNEKKSTLDKLQKEQDLAKRYKKLQEDLATIRFSIVSKRSSEAEEEMGRLNSLREEEEKKLEETKKKLEELDKELEELQNEMGSLTKEAIKGEDRKVVEEITKIRSELDKKMTKIEYNRREISNLEDMINTLNENVTGSAKHVLALNKKGVHGTIGSLFSVDSKFRTAAEIAAGGRINDVVVDNDAIAQECIDYLKKNNLGRVTFLPLSKLKPIEKSIQSRGMVDEDGVVDFMINLVKYDARYDVAFRQVFGDTLLLSDLKTARRYIGRARMVTLDGEIIQKSGAMTGGSLKKRSESKASSYLQIQSRLESEIGVVEEEIKDLEKRLKELEDREDSSSFKKTDFERDYEIKQKKVNDLRKVREELYETRVNGQSKINNFNIRAARIEADIKNLEAQGDGLEERKVLDLPIEELDRQKRQVLESLDKIGAVNFKAIEDYETMKIVYEDLNKKVERIDKEKESVLRIAESIEAQRRETFMKTFDNINKNFADIYGHICNGKAYLELEEEENIRSGMFLRARPQGKKELNLDAMSGGEKTITALAFLFAVQMYKPAPFYILDEVDAALDKKNTQKIAELVESYSKNAQFIIISHNDTMIRKAERVYGISMENGVSKIVSLELPESN